MSKRPNDPHLDLVKSRIRAVPDFPQPGIIFRDITPLLADGHAWRIALDLLEAEVKGMRPDVLIAIESRGFLFGAPLAARLGIGLVPVRKPGKLPYEKTSIEYALEYGQGTLEMHVDGLEKGQRVVIVDDVIATGGTAWAACELARLAGATPVGAAFFVELTFLEGRKRLAPVECRAVLAY